MAQYCARNAPPDTVPFAEGDTARKPLFHTYHRERGHTTQDPKTPMEDDFTKVRRMSGEIP